MNGKWLDVASEDVIWTNLSMNPLQQRVRVLISWGVTIALVVFWSLPVGFVGMISNVNSLCSKVSWMAWLCKLPAPVPGIIQGILPPAGMAILFILLPIFLRFLAKFQGIPLNSRVELSLMSRYFTFLVIHGQSFTSPDLVHPNSQLCAQAILFSLNRVLDCDALLRFGRRDSPDRTAAIFGGYDPCVRTPQSIHLLPDLLCHHLFRWCRRQLLANRGRGDLHPQAQVPHLNPTFRLHHPLRHVFSSMGHSIPQRDVVGRDRYLLFRRQSHTQRIRLDWVRLTVVRVQS